MRLRTKAKLPESSQDSGEGEDSSDHDEDAMDVDNTPTRRDAHLLRRTKSTTSKGKARGTNPAIGQDRGRDDATPQDVPVSPTF